MNQILLNSVSAYVRENIGSFHSRRLESLRTLQLRKILARKNPYLFKAKNILTAQELIETILQAHLSSQEETVFGEFLEGLAIFVNEKVFSGKKSSAEGIDIEFRKNEVHYLVTIKSGPNWGNSGQIARMVDDFKKAKRILRTSGHKIQIIAVNGCCYGKTTQEDKGDYFKYSGQKFWEFISNEETLYTDIIEPLGEKAKEKNEEFLQSYAQIINRFTQEFLNQFCIDGIINWTELVKFNSSAAG